MREHKFFPWKWQRHPIRVSFETLGPMGQDRGLTTHSRPALLPAFSTASTREEMYPLAECLAARGFGCLLVDWPGFGDCARGAARAPADRRRIVEIHARECGRKAVRVAFAAGATGECSRPEPAILL